MNLSASSSDTRPVWSLLESTSSEHVGKILTDGTVYTLKSKDGETVLGKVTLGVIVDVHSDGEERHIQFVARPFMVPYGKFENVSADENEVINEELMPCLSTYFPSDVGIGDTKDTADYCLQELHKRFTTSRAQSAMLHNTARVLRTYRPAPGNESREQMLERLRKISETIQKKAAEDHAQCCGSCHDLLCLAKEEEEFASTVHDMMIDQAA
jgi:hypothetical protein